MNATAETPLKEPKPVILYIGGYGRSGSTMLDRLLGQIPGVISLGETRHIWQRAFRENQWVSGGIPFRDCPFWNEVINIAFGRHDCVDLERIDTLRASVDRVRSIPRLRKLTRQSDLFKEQVEEFGGILNKLYSAIREVSGCSLIVDSSKHPCYAYLLAATGHFDLRLIHMVRDPRASAYSWQRRRQRPEIYWEKKEMPQFNPAVSAVHWSIANALLESLRHNLEAPSVRLRYEDLVAAPAERVREVWRLLEFSEPDLSFIDGQSAKLREGFTIAGNPSRFKSGQIEIKADEEWRTKMEAGSKRLVSLLSFFHRRKYAYQ